MMHDHNMVVLRALASTAATVPTLAWQGTYRGERQRRVTGADLSHSQ